MVLAKDKQIHEWNKRVQKQIQTKYSQLILEKTSRQFNGYISRLC